MFKYTIFFLLTILCTSLYGIDSFPMNELKFKKFFGQRIGDNKIYCLLGNGFFRTVSSNEEDVIISDWLCNHPNAKAIPVSIVGEGSQMVLVYIWAIDGTESLNLNLIKNGAFPDSVMLDAVHFQVLAKGSPDQENIKAGIAYARKLNPNLPIPKEVPPRRLIPDSTYNNFLKDLKNAQNIAQIQKSGIWSDKFINLHGEFHDTEKNETSANIQTNQLKTLSQIEANDAIESHLLMLKVMHQCAALDNVKNKTDMAMCVRSAIVNWQAIVFDGKKIDVSDKRLYQRWHENYKSADKDKHIYPSDKKKFDDFFHEYQLCLNKSIQAKVFNDSKEIRNHFAKECKVAFEKVISIDLSTSKATAVYSNDDFSKIIARDIRYPEEARRNHQEGDVIVSFTLLSSGEIKDLVIIKSSGFKLLDDETLALIKRNAPNLPKSVTRRFSIPISYKLK